MKKAPHIQIVAFITLFGLCLSNLSSKAQKKEQPNILLFVADDMTWSDCEPYGNEQVITPHISELAEAGMCFDNMYTATAMSAPTRQQLYTGLFPVRSGAYPNHGEVYEGVKSLATYFNQMGYRTALIGKKHYGPAESFPFEYLGEGPSTTRNGPDMDIQKIRPVMEQEDQPFFLVVATNQPHKPWEKGQQKLYEGKHLRIPDYMVDCPETRENLKRYYAEITHADSLLGQSMDLLEESDKRENTLVIFTSEQGAQFPFAKWTCYDRGLKTAFIVRWPGKVKPDTRTDAMTQYVDVVPTLLEAAGASPDHINTGAADLNGSGDFDGSSFVDVLKGKKHEHRNYVFGIQTTRGIFSGSVCYPIRSVRNHRFKYILNLNSSSPFYNLVVARENSIYHSWLNETSGNTEKHQYVKRYKYRPKEELYDMKQDPWEMHNLADDPQYKEVKNELRKQLRLWMQQQGDQGIDTELKAIQRQPRWNETGWRSYEEQRNQKILKRNQ